MQVTIPLTLGNSRGQVGATAPCLGGEANEDQRTAPQPRAVDPAARGGQGARRSCACVRAVREFLVRIRAARGRVARRLARSRAPPDADRPHARHLDLGQRARPVRRAGLRRCSAEARRGRAAGLRPDRVDRMGGVVASRAARQACRPRPRCDQRRRSECLRRVLGGPTPGPAQHRRKARPRRSGHHRRRRVSGGPPRRGTQRGEPPSGVRRPSARRSDAVLLPASSPGASPRGRSATGGRSHRCGSRWSGGRRPRSRRAA